MGVATSNFLSSTQNLTGAITLTFSLTGSGGGTARIDDITLNGTVTATGNTVPTLSTPTSASITTTTATLGATIVSNGGVAISESGVVYGTSATPTLNPTQTSPLVSTNIAYTVPVSSLLPQTSPTFSNMTVMGPKATLANVGNAQYFKWGAQIRRNSSMSLFNSIIMGYPNGLYIDATKGVPTDNNIPSSLLVQNTIIAGCPNPVLYSLGSNSNVPTTPNTTASITAWFNTSSLAK